MQTQRGAHVLKTSGEQVQVFHDHGRGRVVDLFALRRRRTPEFSRCRRQSAGTKC